MYLPATAISQVSRRLEILTLRKTAEKKWLRQHHKNLCLQFVKGALIR